MPKKNPELNLVFIASAFILLATATSIHHCWIVSPNYNGPINGTITYTLVPYNVSEGLYTLHVINTTMCGLFGLR